METTFLQSHSMEQVGLQVNQAQSTELIPLEIIRTETVLSKLPIHNLSKKGDVDIHIVKTNKQGQVELFWEVSYSSRYGQARQLAYKLDTIVVNRYIDERERPLPKMFRLGSLRQICEDLGLDGSGDSINRVKKAFRQNAFAGITAKFTYKGRDGVARYVEASDTRYGVIFTGENLPDGTKADAVYLMLHDFYWEVLNNAPVRPLDYTYLKGLTPSAQRLYEIVSFRIFAAIRHRQPRAKLAYSDYCTFSAQQRYYDYEHVKKQMYKVHKPHKESGYLTKISYLATTDNDGNPDWLVFYTPGPKALAEYEVFHKKKRAGQDKLFFKGTEEGPLDQLSVSEPVAQEAIGLVQYFYERFYNIEQATAQPKEIEQACQLIEEHGIDKATYLVEFAHRVASETNYEPQVFGGILSYLPRSLDDYQKHERTCQKEQEKKQHAQAEERRLQAEEARRVLLKARYQSFSPEEQARLQEQAKANLLKQGYKPETMFTAVVNSEIYRLMEAQENS